ncbi:MAG TPA: heme-binding protein [Candidatus Methylomirabilis sp.]|nr:heme-binding protein [Candidatus Methylomirabilis sp.]
MNTIQRTKRNQPVLVLGVALLGLILAAGSAWAADLPSEKVLPLSLATEAAQGALAACEAKGFHISVAVTDQAGLVRVLLRDDKAGPHTLDSSRKKAYTATSLGLATGVLTKIVTEHPAAAGLKDMNQQILIMQGGLPITAGADVIGGIGVGGTPGGDTDEACARAGLDKIKDRLK